VRLALTRRLLPKRSWTQATFRDDFSATETDLVEVVLER
jgi:hypothetical protein